MRFKMTLALAAALAMSAAACGGDDDSLSAGGFATGLASGFCGKAFECMSTFPGTAADFSAAFGADETACKAMFVSGAMLQAAVDAGRVTFNAADGSSCLSAINGFTCPQFWDPNTPFPTTCNTALVGTVATGGACTLNAECVSASCNGTTCNAPGVAPQNEDHLPQSMPSHLAQ